MSVLVDTSVWSLALGRKGRSSTQQRILKKLILDNLVEIIGPIRQELLSGLSRKTQFEQLKHHLSYFPDIPLESVDFELAAEFFNVCRKKGIQGSHTDFLICAVAYSHNFQILTIDKDFSYFRSVLPIKLFTEQP